MIMRSMVRMRRRMIMRMRMMVFVIMRMMVFVIMRMIVFVRVMVAAVAPCTGGPPGRLPMELPPPEILS